MVSSKYKVTKEEKVSAENWFSELRDAICFEFQNIEKNISNNTFQIKNWKRDGGGGGKMSVMKGDVFEKVGVNISTVHGKFSEQLRKNIPGAEKDGKFWASGISVVAHPKNPFIPAAHMNTRLISTSKSWFGGGGDITPMKPAPEMSKLFHKDFKNVCDKHNKEYYWFIWTNQIWLQTLISLLSISSIHLHKSLAEFLWKVIRSLKEFQFQTS